MNSTTLQSKVKSVLSIHYDSSELNESLEYLSDLPYSSTTNLRSQLQLRAIDQSAEFLRQYQTLVQLTDVLESSCHELQTTCSAIDSQCQSALSQSSELLSQNHQLQSDRDFARSSAAIADALLKNFTLNQEELRLLSDSSSTTSADGSPNPALLKVLFRAQKILSHDSKLLLQSPTHQRLGLEVMADLSENVERAQRAISSWFISHECEKVLSNHSLSLTTDLTHAAEVLGALRSNPELYRTCLNALSTSRTRAFGSGFLSALSIGSANCRPIELHSDDELRYVGDMLGWIHQSLASEQDLLQHSLSLSVDTEIQSVLCSASSSLSKPFSLRFSQSISSNPGPLILFKLVGILDYYTTVISRFLLPSSSLSSTIFDCRLQAHSLLAKDLHEIVQKLIRSPPIPTTDLSCPLQIKDMSTLFSELLGSSQSSVTANSGISELILSVISPLPDILQSAATASKLDCVSSLVWRINSLSSLSNGLLQDIVDCLVTELVDAESERFLMDVGIAQKLLLVNQFKSQKQPTGMMSSQLGLEPQQIESVVRNFEAALLDLGASLVSPSVSRLVPKFQQSVQNGVSNSMIANITLLYDAITNPSSGYPDNGSRIFRYKPEQLKVVIDV